MERGNDEIEQGENRLTPILSSISSDIPLSTMRKIAREYLGYTNDLDVIEYDNEAKGEVEVVFQIFNKWYQRNPACTRDQLTDILRRANQQLHIQVTDHVFEILQRGKITNHIFK